MEGIPDADVDTITRLQHQIKQLINENVKLSQKVLKLEQENKQYRNKNKYRNKNQNKNKKKSYQNNQYWNKNEPNPVFLRYTRYGEHGKKVGWQQKI